MDRIQFRRDSSENWKKHNPTLMEGEVGYEIDTRKRKIGDGRTAWNDLKYLAAENISQELGDDDNLVLSQSAITELITEGYLYKGIADTTTNITEPTGKIFYIVTTPGNYIGFGNITINGGLNIVKWDGTTWIKDEVQLDVTKEQVDEIEELLNNTISNVGIDEYETFSTSKAYAVGDVVSYNNKLYKFIVPHSAGAFDEGQVEETSLKRDLEKNFNTVSSIAYTDNTYVNDIIKSLYIDTSKYKGDKSLLFIRVVCKLDDINRIQISSTEIGFSPINFDTNDDSLFNVSKNTVFGELTIYALADWNKAYTSTTLNAKIQSISYDSNFFLNSWLMQITDDITENSDNIASSNAVYKLLYNNVINIIALETQSTFEYSSTDKSIYLGGKSSLRMVDTKNRPIINSSAHYLCNNKYRIDLSDFLYNRIFIFIKNSQGNDAILVVNTNSDIGFINYKDYALYAILWINTENYALTDLFCPSMIGYTYNNTFFAAKRTEIANTTGDSTQCTMSQKAITDKFNACTSWNLLKDKNIYTLGDSLSYDGIWQNKLCEITGCVFDSKFNIEQGISVGGTLSGPCGNSCAQDRVKNLSNAEKQIDVLFIENINDKSFVSNNKIGSINDEPWFIRKTLDIGTFNSVAEIESYWESNFTLIIGEPYVGTALQAKYKSAGKAYKLHIDTAPTNNGVLTINCYGSKYNISINSTDNVDDVIRKILEYSYVGWNDDFIDGDIILFTRTDEADSKRWIQVDAGDTGITFTLNAADGEGLLGKYYCFTSYNLENYTNKLYWKDSSEISLYSIYKGLLEYVCSTYKKCQVIWIAPPRFNLTYIPSSANSKEDGTYNIDAYEMSTDNDEINQLYEVQKEVCELFNIKFINIEALSGINVYNFSEFYNENNVHPKDEGYYKYAEVIASNL